mgnify:CR=1 FL=1
MPKVHLIRFLAVAAVLTVSGLLAARGSAPQIYSKASHQSLALQPGDLEAHGLAFITPSTVTGQEEEKQAVAFTFADELSKVLPYLRIIHLSETLSAINAAGLADDVAHDQEIGGKLHIFDNADFPGQPLLIFLQGVFQRPLFLKLQQPDFPFLKTLPGYLFEIRIDVVPFRHFKIRENIPSGAKREIAFFSDFKSI